MSNISPTFAREASQLLHDGYIQQATELCLAGTGKFPNYATGFLILGKCYDVAGSPSNSLITYRRALSLLPDHPTLQELVRQAEAKAPLPSIGSSGIERAEVKEALVEPAPIQLVAETIVSHNEADQPRDSILPNVEATPALNERLIETQEQTDAESPLDYLTRRLQTVKRMKPNPAATQNVHVEVERGMNFVTPTMAEIYVGQGEYREAINAYNELIRQNPSEEKLKRRRVEIEQLLVVQAREKS